MTHPDRRKTVAERAGNKGRIASARSVWLVFYCPAFGSPGGVAVFGSKEAAAKAIGCCAIEDKSRRCRMERFVPASMRTRTVKVPAPMKGYASKGKTK